MTTLSEVDKDYLVSLLVEQRARIEYSLGRYQVERQSPHIQQMVGYLNTLIEKVKNTEEEDEE